MDLRSLLPLALGLLLVAGIGFAVVVLRRRRHERGLRELLDLADDVQALLARTGERMAAWRGTVGRLAGDLGNGAQRALDGEPLVKDAKRDLLQHRLWIQSKGLRATPAELAEAREALKRAKGRLEEQLAALESAGDALAQATDAAHEAARREPASLRRAAEDPPSAQG
jgi:hypothetical protein